jgi:hypothetical protein
MGVTLKSWGERKASWLAENGRPTFEQVLEAIAEGGLLDIRDNNTHADRKIFVVRIAGKIHAVPVIPLTNGEYQATTVFPSKKLEKEFGGKT